MTGQVRIPANPPLAGRMGLIAIVNANLTVACIFGTFSVLLASVQSQLHVSMQWAVLGVSAMTCVSSVSGPYVGQLANKFSLRKMMVTGAALNVAGFAVLAVTNSLVAYLLAYGLLLGFAMTFVGYVLPGTLVTRWFRENQGFALGLTYAPIAAVPMPLLTTRVLGAFGLSTTYWMLTAISAVPLIANFFIVDRPAADSATTTGLDAGESASALPITKLIRQRAMWLVILVATACMSVSYIELGLTVPIARTWGFAAEDAALLMSIYSASGIAGTIASGWIADRLGGNTTLALLASSLSVLCLALVLLPPFSIVAAIFGALGFIVAGVIPATGVALGETVGKQNFSTGFGIFNFACLPVGVLIVPATVAIFARLGTYSPVLFLLALCLALAVALTTAAKRMNSDAFSALRS